MAFSTSMSMYSHQNGRCCPPPPCCNPFPPCCITVRPNLPCPMSPCCKPPPPCRLACPVPDPRCCPAPITCQFKCPRGCPEIRPKAGYMDCSDFKCPPKNNSACCGDRSRLLQ